jgi:hypothetical protein
MQRRQRQIQPTDATTYWRSLSSEICYCISDMGDLTLKVLKRAKAACAGSALTPKAFADLGNRAAVDQALS